MMIFIFYFYILVFLYLGENYVFSITTQVRLKIEPKEPKHQEY